MSLETQAQENEPEGEVSGAYANYVLGVLFVVYVFNFMDRQVLSIVIEPLKLELGLSDTQIGLLAGFAFSERGPTARLQGTGGPGGLVIPEWVSPQVSRQAGIESSGLLWISEATNLT